ncbi:hypothetical protein U2P60_06115 [Brucella sp. H1_1004]|uniref:hypothetical protein n=1 Tax=Brucella sp. H1_1004 TaxID=3110109 RepID=UPI0039B3D01B
MGDVISFSTIFSGTTSRLIKKTWVDQNCGVLAIAFDLRDRTPPEVYVSFSMTTGSSDDEHVQCACNDLSKKFSGKLKGFIALLDVEECLSDINDEPQDIISFRDQSHPHCGLYYMTEDLQKIQEAKTTLAFLATERLSRVPEEEILLNR